MGSTNLSLDYLNIEDCIGNSVGSPIPWAIDNPHDMQFEVFEASMDSSRERINFENDDDEMEDLQNSKVELPRSSKSSGLLHGLVIPRDS